MLSSVIRRKIPFSPRSPTTVVTQSASLSVTDARTSSVERGTGGQGSVGRRMAVPLFDPNTPLEPLRQRLDDALAGRARRRPLHPGPERHRVRAGVRRLSRRRPRDRRRERHRGADDRAARARRRARATRSSCRRSRSTRAPRRSRRPARRPVFCDVDPRHVPRHARDGARGADAAHEGGHRRPPVRQRRAGRARSRRSACRSSRTPRRPPARSARTGARARSGRSRRSPSTRRRTSARSATAARSRPATRRSPSACARCASTARATRSPTRRSATTAASTSCRPRSCACCCRSSSSWAAHRHAAGALVRGGGPRRAGRRCRADARRARPAWHLYVVRHERADELQAALAARGVEARGYYRTPVHRQQAMRAWGGGADLPATDEAARTHLALPISAGDHARAGRPRSSPPCATPTSASAACLRVWIDLTNSPHVLVLRPVIERLRAAGRTRCR